MKKPAMPLTSFTFLREKAEELLQNQSIGPMDHLPIVTGEADLLKLVHELQVYQVEMELQNEELKLAKVQTEAALRETELARLKYYDLYDFAPTGYFTMSKESKINELNFYGSQMLGQERAVLLNHRFDLYVSNETRPIFIRFLEDLFSGESKITCELSLTIKGSMPIDLQLTGIVANDGENCLVTAVDITKRRLAEKELQETRKNLEAVFNATDESIFLVSADKTLIAMNDVGAMRLGSSRENLTGKKMDQLLSPNVISKRHNSINQLLLAGQPVAFEDEQNGKWLSNHIYPIEDENGNIVRMAVFSRDISALRQIEQALHASEERFRLLFENSGEGILYSLAEGTIVSANPEACRIFGQSETDICAGGLDGLLVPDIPNFKKILELRAKTGKVEAIVKGIRNDGSSFPCEINSTIFYDSAGQKHANTILRDISGRVKAETEIKQKNEELNNLNSQKDRFFSIIAHDLRGPFNGFLGLTKIMSEKLLTLSFCEIQEFTANLFNSATNLFRLLENLLQWSRLQQGLIVLSPEKFDLTKAIKESLEPFRESAEFKRIKITTKIADSLIAFADNNFIQTILRNLISNALKFTKIGGSVEINANVLNDKYVQISVRDSGIGMSAEMVKNLFRIDIRTNRKGTEGESSTGLGLLLCKDFIEKQGGEIKIESVERLGSQFSFTIPRLPNSF